MHLKSLRKDNKIEMFNTRLINSLLFLNLTALTLFNYNEVTSIIKQWEYNNNNNNNNDHD